MTKTLIVPGLDGSPAPHWQQWWAATDPTALMVDLTEPERPLPAIWEIELGGMILRHPDSILVGHSLGAVLIARMLTQWPHLKVRAALLVAPADPAAAPRIAAFGPLPETRLGIPVTLAASRNDPWMEIGRAQQLAQVWGADFIDLGLAGHVNAEAGFGPWPQGKALRDDLAGLHSPAKRPQRHETPHSPARQAIRRTTAHLRHPLLHPAILFS